jgi:hypothetical protein
MIAGGKVPATIFKKQKSIDMKKLTAAIAALALFFTATASDPTPESEFNSLFNTSNSKIVSIDNVNKSITSAFSQKFGKATAVNWKENQGLYFAYFKQFDKDFAAAYNDQGELIAISRTVALDALPLAVSDALYTQFVDHNIPNTVTEIVMEGETSYYLTVENKTAHKQLKCTPSGEITVVKKLKKKVLVGRVEV